MSGERHGGLRAMIAMEAARLMYEEAVKEYFTAKRMAAKRILGRIEGRRLRFRPADLPSNGEIRDALLALAELAEGSSRTRRLFAMRVKALEIMRELGPFEPRLIGSVSTGHIRRGSDIDLQVFTDHEETLESHLQKLGRTFERQPVTIHKFSKIRDYVHYHLTDVFEIELTVYPVRELRFRPRSSTDGKPIVRVRVPALEKRLEQEHAQAWARYRADGVIEGLDGNLGAEDDDDAPGGYDGILIDDEPAIDEIALPEPGEADDPDQQYDPLPGFEDAG